MRELPLPAHYDPSRVGEVWRVPYEELRARGTRLVREARPRPRRRGHLPPLPPRWSTSRTRSASRASSCSWPDGPARAPWTTTAGSASSSTGTWARSRRSSRASTRITRCSCSTRSGWSTSRATPRRPTRSSPRRTSRAVAGGSTSPWPRALGIDLDYAARHLAHYTERLAAGGKYDLTVWPYHALLGGIGHALVSAVEEAAFFHGIARYSQPEFQVKGENPLTEHYSMLGPEVTEGPDGDRLGGMNTGARREAAGLRRRRRGRAGEEPLPGVDDRRPAGGRGRAGARPRRADLPARGLHVSGRGARRDRLHGRGRCRVRALRGGRHARGPFDGSGRELAGAVRSGSLPELRDFLLSPEEAAEMDAPGTKDAAVLIPLFERDGDLVAVFTERRHDLRRHAGEISFPGGRQDFPEEDLRDDRATRGATRRSACSPSDSRACRRPAPHGYLRDQLPHPPVRRADRGRPRVAAAGERGGRRARAARCPSCAAATRCKRLLKKGLPIKTPTYTVDGHCVWGATARIVEQLLERLP